MVASDISHAYAGPEKSRFYLVRARTWRFSIALKLRLWHTAPAAYRSRGYRRVRGSMETTTNADRKLKRDEMRLAG